ncbi:hypothetical protein JCM19239_6817 [Vibrio variabilis]|uniref:Uncharacterized protein n=1 Tax=Vibrio variabilis TaxID=990271 RepID=A0ABQ0JN63_9VIBR|nr:hypothetical protein JCM19239_6817 [Vibrio variabilis]
MSMTNPKLEADLMRRAIKNSAKKFPPIELASTPDEQRKQLNQLTALREIHIAGKPKNYAEFGYAYGQIRVEGTCITNYRNKLHQIATAIFELEKLLGYRR